MEDNRRRHCWECIRRRLVCDSARPTCHRCSSSMILCPGYNDTKPLRWLSTGRALGRNRKHSKRAQYDQVQEHSFGDYETLRSVAIELPPRGEIDDLVHLNFNDAKLDAASLHVQQAAEYYNTCIYRDLMPVRKLGPNPHIHHISSTHLRGLATLPDYLRLGFVCMTLSHRINRMRGQLNNTQINALSETFYRYRGMVIRSLSDDIAVETRCMGDEIIAGIISLLLADAQQGASADWRSHVEAVQRLITLRGGLRALAVSNTIKPPLLCFIYTTVIGNTTSPVEGLVMTRSHLDELDCILEEYGGGILPFQSCPPDLFAEIIKINYLRSQAAEYNGTENPCDLSDLSQEGYEILTRIGLFSPERWAKSKPSAEDKWSLLGNIFQAAVGLFCISSLQSQSVLPKFCPLLNARRTTQYQLLQKFLNEALSTPEIKRLVLWPLVMLGIELVHINGNAVVRAFVAEQLLEMSREIGTFIPLTAKTALEGLWASGQTPGMDVCFKGSYVFSTQLAVDISGML